MRSWHEVSCVKTLRPRFKAAFFPGPLAVRRDAPSSAAQRPRVLLCDRGAADCALCTSQGRHEEKQAPCFMIEETKDWLGRGTSTDLARAQRLTALPAWAGVLTSRVSISLSINKKVRINDL